MNASLIPRELVSTYRIHPVDEERMDPTRRRPPWGILVAYAVAIVTCGRFTWVASRPMRYVGEDFLQVWIQRAVENFLTPHPVGTAYAVLIGIGVWIALLAPLFFYHKRAGKRCAGVALSYIVLWDLLLLVFLEGVGAR